MEIHWSIHLLEHLGMDIDDQTSLKEVITGSNSSNNSNELNMI